MQLEKIESLIANLPDANGARHFYRQFAEKFPAPTKKLVKNEGLLADVLTLAAFSPLLATTLLQNPEYVAWLERQRKSAIVRGKDEMLESLERFALVNSNVETNVLLARFRRRELLRVYLNDIRRLETIAETTEEISNLADAVLEYALRQARQTLDNRYGAPLETDEKDRAKPARFCVVALGKLGSRELNYASDIDLLFLYSNAGATTGQGARGEAVTNREYFVKLAETVTKIVGAQAGEGAAYRVDLRLRPNGTVGALAISLDEAVNYYRTTARAWERQVLIRSRAAAGDAEIFQRFYESVKPLVFSTSETVENALENVRLSKEKINREKNSQKGFNVKLGRGGIREIEFIAQALQLAYGARDEWLRRAPHTLISLARLADRKLIGKTDLTELFEAYDFLRALEHRLQMENGLQTHRVPEADDKLLLTARRMNFETAESFSRALDAHSKNVNRIFERVFSGAKTEKYASPIGFTLAGEQLNAARSANENESSLQSFQTFKDGGAPLNSIGKESKTLELLSVIAAPFAERVAANTGLIESLPTIDDAFEPKDYRRIFSRALDAAKDFKSELATLRKIWTPLLLEIVAFDAFEKITLGTAKAAQTALAEACVEAALVVTKRELERRLNREIGDFPFAVLGLGKLGGGGMDYNSDLDLILIYEAVSSPQSAVGSRTENGAENQSLAVKANRLWTADSGLRTFYARAAEIFTTVLSSLTRDGNLYRVDLRLRPDGKNGAIASEKSAFVHYLSERAAVWEWLAYVKIRAVAGDSNLAESVEQAAKSIVHRRAVQIDAFELKNETRRVRERLEREKSGARKTGEVDIKFGAGGMLDVYFAARFLQLRDNLPDAPENRSTAFTLEKLFANGSLSDEDFQNFSGGYEFLSRLDHNLRLSVGGRATLIPRANPAVLQVISERMKLASAQALIENLTVHRLNVRASFERVIGG